MLKITMNTVTPDIMVKLEGRLAGLWVEELEKAWNTIRAGNDSEKARVDLQGVTYVDDGGKELLQRIHQQGGALKASGCMTKALVDELTSDKICDEEKALDPSFREKSG